jgi:phenazine biosynthesis protein phzE
MPNQSAAVPSATESALPSTTSESTVTPVAALDVLARLLAPEPPPFAVLHRPGTGTTATAEILLGDLITVDRTGDLPEPFTDDLPVLAVVPFRQIRERGFEAVDDGAPMLVLRARQRVVLDLAALIEALPDGPQTYTDTGFDVPDAEYERMVRAVLDDEIAAGSGSNFVIHRCRTGSFDPVTEPPARAALGVLKRLLLGERRAYWTFAVHTPQSTFVGATPERHVSLDAGIVRMNPISGTLRYPVQGWTDPQAHRDALLAFLADPKERDELAMVVDEELKMMAVVGDRGGRVRGPYLKEMAHLAHTEYVLEGRTSFDARQVLAATMFAPTVTGSPIRNACRVIARQESRGRRYYGGVLALIGRDAEGGSSLESPILIRTAEIAADGSVRVAAGATLVRGSKPESELAETRAKAAGIVAALLPTPDHRRSESSGGSETGLASVLVDDRSASVEDRPEQGRGAGLAQDPQILEVLAGRNRTLARFWLQEQAGRSPQGHPQPEESRSRLGSGRSPAEVSHPAGRITVINAEDDFTGMLAHVLGTLGFEVEVQPWQALTEAGGSSLADVELLVLGPGPGDPHDLSDPRILALHLLAKARLAAAAPVLGICLGHQILSAALGLRVERLPLPDQGRQTGISLFGTPHRVGFYNSFVVRAPDHPTPGLIFSLDDDGRRVQALRGEMVTGLQFHPESVLTTAGPEILAAELARLRQPSTRPRA